MPERNIRSMSNIATLFFMTQGRSDYAVSELEIIKRLQAINKKEATLDKLGNESSPTKMKGGLGAHERTVIAIIIGNTYFSRDEAASEYLIRKEAESRLMQNASIHNLNYI